MSFSFADRLVMQRMRLHERDVNIETERESLVVKEKLIEKLNERLDVAKEQLAKVEKLRVSLEKMDDDTEVAYEAAKKKDEEARAALAAEYQIQINDVNAKLQEMGQRESTATRLNSTYKQQIEVYSERSVTGESKMAEYMKLRDDKVTEVKEKKDRDAAMIPEFKELLEKERQQLIVAKAEHDEVKAQVDIYLTRFAEIQGQLDESKKTYEDAKSEKDRLYRTLRALESDKGMLVKRAEHSRSERDKILMKVSKAEAQLADIKAQAQKFNKMCAVFEGKEEEKAPDTEKEEAPQPPEEAAEVASE